MYENQNNVLQLNLNKYPETGKRGLSDLFIPH